MAQITTRAGKGEPLTHQEVDNNFLSLNAATAGAYNPIATIFLLPNAPADGDQVEVLDSTGIESLLTIQGMPAGFVGSSELMVRLRYSSSASKWQWISYAAKDPDPRYLSGTARVEYRNRIVNGGMAIDQRHTGGTETFVAGQELKYGVDCWYAFCSGGNVVGQRVAGDDSLSYRYRLTGAAGVTGVSLGQRIEWVYSADLAGGPATLSVDLANSLLTTVNWAVYYPTGATPAPTYPWFGNPYGVGSLGAQSGYSIGRTFGNRAAPTRTQIASGSFTVNGTVSRYQATFSVPSAATSGLEVVFSVGAQVSGTWTIGDVQLEAGRRALAFEKLSLPQQGRRCQRYFAVSQAAISGVSTMPSATFADYIPYPVPMARVPSIVGAWTYLNASSVTENNNNGDGGTDEGRRVRVIPTEAPAGWTDSIYPVNAEGYIYIDASLL